MNFEKMTAAQLGAGIGAGKIDPVELAQTFLAKIDASKSGDLIYARTTPDRALKEAEAAQRRMKNGTRKGVLDGVPVAWKDLFDTAGIATESGSKLLQGRIPEADCDVLKRATDAGCICLGKTHQTELAFSGLGVNPQTATPPNIHDPKWAPGGSSSGSAAAVAFEMAPLAIGSDTGGSVRIPAAWNDLVGLKTTAGRIPNDGVVPLCNSFDTVGPLTKSVEDAALMFEVLGGRKVQLDAVPDIAGLRFLVSETLVMEECDDQQLAAFERTIVRLETAGATIERSPIATIADATAIGPTLFPYEAYQQWGETIEANPSVVFEPVRNRFFGGKGITRDQFDQAWQSLLAHRSAYEAALKGYDGLILPTTPMVPPEVEQLLQDLDFFWDANLMALRNTRVGNLLGLCALTLPTDHPACGFMIFASPNAEERLLQVGSALEGLVKGD